MRPAPITERKRCRAAANMMLLLCLMNVGPVMLLTAMGMAGAAMSNPDRPFNSFRAMVTGLALFALPLLVAQVWVRRGRMGAILFGLAFELALVGGLVYLLVNVLEGLFLPQFKLLTGALSVLTLGTYALGILRLVQAAVETHRQRSARPPLTTRETRR